MSTVLDKDRMIVAQNAANAAAAIVAAEIKVGVPFDTERFEQIRGDIFDVSLALAEVTLQSQEAFAAPTADAIATIGGAFPGATNVSGTPQAAAPPAASGWGKIIKPMAEAPPWLASQFAASGCYPGEDLWDNRKDLPEFGGKRNPKGPWFKGADSGEGIWPPR
jgi:hypothetical protein